MHVFGITGWKNSGKTGLVERVVSTLCARGYKVSTIKHTHHRVDVDQEGRDSFRHRTAGAQEVVLASSARIAIMQELRGAPEPSLADLLARMNAVDIVIVEGFKSEDHPKIECHRRETHNPLRAGEDSTIKAVATDYLLDMGLPRFELDDTGAIVAFILAELAVGDV